MTEKRIKDPATYRKMSEPFETPDAANDALEAFFQAVRELRVTHHIQDVHLIASVNILNADGEEYPAMTSAHFGDLQREEMMVAWELGRCQRDRQERVGAAMSQAIQDRKAKK